VRVALRVVPDRINDHVRFLDQLYYAARGRATLCVPPVGEQYDGLAALNLTEPLGDRQLNRVVQPRVAARLRPQNRFAQGRTVIRELRVNINLVIERNHHDAVIGAQLPDEGDGGLLNVFEPEPSAA